MKPLFLINVQKHSWLSVMFSVGYFLGNKGTRQVQSGGSDRSEDISPVDEGLSSQPHWAWAWACLW